MRWSSAGNRISSSVCGLMAVVWALGVAFSVILWGIILTAVLVFDASLLDSLNSIVIVAAISTLAALGAGFLLFRKCGRWP